MNGICRLLLAVALASSLFAGAAAENGSQPPASSPDNQAEKSQPEEPKARQHDLGKTNAPGWGKGHEELYYRLTFLGVTAGYARFSIMGKTIVDGRQVWHLHVRGWTSQFLSVFYPVNNIMDYYLDVKTLAPVRIDVTKNEKKKFTDEVVLYDQDKGQISYWDKTLTKMEKKVDVTPNVHDPVTAVYYFRAKDTGNPDRSRNVYAGRKMWQIASSRNGTETIPDEFGQPVETTIIRPIIRRDGKIESKGDIKMWLTNDERHIPIRIYASIKIGTLVGQLIPPQEGG
ncbi:MAG TPA: DUF3108 domain-containing protein [Candidatus Deferrimicrobiaceae bacterium]|jgi:hypothetical protein